MDSIGQHTQPVPYPGIPRIWLSNATTVSAAKTTSNAVLQQLSLFLMQDFVPNMQDRPDITSSISAGSTVKRNPASFNKSLQQG